MKEILRQGFDVYMFVFILLWLVTFYSTILAAAGAIAVIGVLVWQYRHGKIYILNMCLYVGVFAALATPGFYYFWLV